MNKKLTIIILSAIAILSVGSYIVAGDRENIVATSTPRVAIDNEARSSLFYNGTTHQISVPFSSSLTFDNTDNITIFSRVKPAFSNTSHDFVKQGTEIVLRTVSNTQAEFLLNSLSTVDRVNAGTLKVGEWNDVVGTYDGTDLSIYVNGVLAESVQPTGTYGGDTGAFLIGQGITDGEDMIGNIKATKIWNVALTADQILNLYANNITPTTGLVLNLDLNEGAGTTAYDTSGNGNNGTITGATWSTDVPSKARATSTPRQVVVDDKASLLFDGSGDKISASASAIGVGYTFSLDAKFGDSPHSSRALFDTNPSAGGSIRLFTSTNGIRHDIGGSVTAEYATKFKPGEWYNFALVVSGVVGDDNKKTTLYIDGVEVDSANNGFAGVITTLEIGNYNAGNWMKGNINNFRTFSTALTSQQISDIYYNKIIPRDNLAGEWTINEGAGATTYDTSGNSNNGTITGATWSSDTPSKKRKVVNGNLVENGDFEIAPAVFIASSTGGIIDGNTGSSYGDYNVRTSGEMEVFKWNMNRYNTDNGSCWYEWKNCYSGNYCMAFYGENIKERVNITLGQRNFGDLSGEFDIREHLIPVKPSTEYKFSFWVKFDVATTTGDPITIIRPEPIEHSATGFITHNYVTFDSFYTEWTYKEAIFTTNSATRYINPYMAAQGNSSNYWSGTMWIDDIVLKKTSDL